MGVREVLLVLLQLKKNLLIMLLLPRKRLLLLGADGFLGEDLVLAALQHLAAYKRGGRQEAESAGKTNCLGV